VGVYASRKTKAEVVVVDWDNIKSDAELMTDEVEERFQRARKKLAELPIMSFENTPPE